MDVKARILIVDDEDQVRTSVAKILTLHGFDAVQAAGLPEALMLIKAKRFDVLLTDLKMQGEEDGLTLISEMRSTNPQTITLLMSAFFDLPSNQKTITLQTDEVLAKPLNIPALITLIKTKLAGNLQAPARVESVAAILERTISSTVDDWLRRVEREKRITKVVLQRELRIAYVPRILADLSDRLRSVRPIGSEEEPSHAAREHGLLRRRQGYSAAMMVQESRMLQVSIFQTLQNNLATIDFSILLIGVMTIADEVDSQLSQAMEGYIAESIRDELPT